MLLIHKWSVPFCWIDMVCNQDTQHWVNSSVVIDLPHTQKYNGPGSSQFPINRPKMTLGLHSKPQPLTFAQHPQRRATAQMLQLCGTTLEECEPFLQALFIFRLSLLTQQGGISLAQTDVWHTWREREDTAGGLKRGCSSRRSKPAGRDRFNVVILFSYTSPWSLLL